MEMGEGRACVASWLSLVSQSKRKPLEVSVLSVLVTLRHTVPFRPLCVMWSCKVGVGYPYVFILL